MKAFFAPFALVAIAALAAPATAADKMQHMDHGAMHAPAAAEVPLTDGLVKKIDKAGGKLTLAHAALPNGMPAMTMAFRVKDAAWLDKLKDGQKVRFAIEKIDGVLTIVRLETAN